MLSRGARAGCGSYPRRQQRQARKDELTNRLGSAAANTQLQQEADSDAAKVVAAVTPKVEQLSTENQLLANTIQQLKGIDAAAAAESTPASTSPLAVAAVGPNPAAGPRATALGEARAAEYYTSTAHALEGFATFWGPFLIIAFGIMGLFWNWYHQHPLWHLVLTVTVLAIASFFPVYVMQLPRAAISPLMKLV